MLESILRDKQDKWTEEKDRKTENITSISDAGPYLQEANRTHALILSFT